MEKLDIKHIAACCEAWRRKKDYEDHLREYYELSGTDRLFSFRPRDPFKGLTLGDLSECVGASFKGAFPELAYAVEDEPGVRLGAREWRADLSLSSDGKLSLSERGTDYVKNLFSEEFFESKQEYGFIHSYQHSDDSRKDNATRQWAYARAMESRLDTPFFKRCYQRFDAFRFDSYVRSIIDGNLAWRDASVKDLKVYVDEAKAFRDKERALSESRNERYYAMQEKYSVDFHDDYVRNLYVMERLSRLGNAATPDDRLEWSAAHSCNLYAPDYLSLLQGEQRRMHEPKSLPVVWDTAVDLWNVRKLYGVDVCGTDDLVNHFSRLAFMEGYGVADVFSYMKDTNSEVAAMFESSLPSLYDRFSAERKAMAVSKVKDLVDRDRSMGHFRVGYPCADFTEIRMKLNDSKEVVDWLRHLVSNGMDIRPDAVGKAVYDDFKDRENQEFIFSRIKDVYSLVYPDKGVSKHAERRFLDGYRQGLAFDFMERYSSPKAYTYTESYTMKPLAQAAVVNQTVMYQQLNGLIGEAWAEDYSMDRLGEILYDAGVSFKEGESIKSALNRAAAELVTSKGPDGVKTKADAFREKWADVLRNIHPAKKDKGVSKTVSKKVEDTRKAAPKL